MKQLTQTYGDLLQDKRVRSEQSKYEAFSRQRSSVISKYRKIYQAFNDLISGLMRAQAFYSDMKETVESLQQNVESFVNNRRSEGGQLLGVIENRKASGSSEHADRERERLRELMERMSVEPSRSPVSQHERTNSRPSPLQQTASYQSSYNPASSPPITPRYPSVTAAASSSSAPYGGVQSPPHHHQPYQPQPPTNGNASYQPQQQQQQPRRESYQREYNPNNYGQMSPPATQQYFSPQQQPQQFGGYQPSAQLPPGYVPPPPPPGPPPASSQHVDYSGLTGGGAAYPSGPGGYAAAGAYRASSQQHPHQQQGQQGGYGQQQGADPWAGLSAWK